MNIKYDNTIDRPLYDPFGNILSRSGKLADANLYRFSSKEFHPASSLDYYTYRYYNSTLQRWLNKDPLEEFGFEALRERSSRMRGRPVTFKWQNLYLFVENFPLGFFDSFGLNPSDPVCLALMAQMQAAIATAFYDESFGNFEGATQEWRYVAMLSTIYDDSGCNDPPPPPEPVEPDLKPCFRNNRYDSFNRIYIPMPTPQQTATTTAVGAGAIVVILVIVFAPVGV